jgi:GDPmannose 4,6-dehydratase
MKRALITGINGQDGSYLAEHLLSRGYTVYGIVRRSSVAENQTYRLNNFIDEVTTIYGDLLDTDSIHRSLDISQPDEIYNLAAQSHVRISYDNPAFTASVNAIGALNLFQAVRSRSCNKNVRVYQASSSEMFGSSVDDDGFQRETTQMTPVSPYGCSKLFAYSAARNSRNAFNIFISNGILFNHESPRRGTNFVTAKVVQKAVKIKLGLDNKLVLGNLDSYRDWGHSKDYVRAMHLILSHDKPDDFVISTGQTHSVRDMCKTAFDMLGLDYLDYVTQDTSFMRPEELPYLKGDSTKARSVLGWVPEYSFEDLLDDMIRHHYEILKP